MPGDSLFYATCIILTADQCANHKTVKLRYYVKKLALDRYAKTAHHVSRKRRQDEHKQMQCNSNHHQQHKHGVNYIRFFQNFTDDLCMLQALKNMWTTRNMLPLNKKPFFHYFLPWNRMRTVLLLRGPSKMASPQTYAVYSSYLWVGRPRRNLRVLHPLLPIIAHWQLLMLSLLVVR